MLRGRVALFVLAVTALACSHPAVAMVDTNDSERLLAPTSACPGQSDPGAPKTVQVRAMRCLTNFARQGRGLPLLARAPALDRAAVHKSADILRCEEFSHEAC